MVLSWSRFTRQPNFVQLKFPVKHLLLRIARLVVLSVLVLVIRPP